jgi:hypothetical protein
VFWIVSIPVSWFVFFLFVLILPWREISTAAIGVLNCVDSRQLACLFFVRFEEEWSYYRQEKSPLQKIGVLNRVDSHQLACPFFFYSFWRRVKILPWREISAAAIDVLNCVDSRQLAFPFYSFWRRVKILPSRGMKKLPVCCVTYSQTPLKFAPTVRYVQIRSFFFFSFRVRNSKFLGF